MEERLDLKEAEKGEEAEDEDGKNAEGESFVEGQPDFLDLEGQKKMINDNNGN